MNFGTLMEFDKSGLFYRNGYFAKLDNVFQEWQISTMNTSYRLDCSHCGFYQWVEFSTHQQSVEFSCENCKNTTVGILDSSITIGKRLFSRAFSEITKSKDFDLSIILSGMAVEAELYRFFQIVKSNEMLKKQIVPTLDEIDSDFQKLYKIKNKLNVVWDLISKNSIEKTLNQFESTYKKALIIINHIPKFEKSNFINYVEEQVFYKRNEILHQSKIFNQEDAKIILSISTLLVDLYQIEFENYKTTLFKGSQ